MHPLNQMRYELIALSERSQTPHLGSCLSCIDLLWVLYDKVRSPGDVCILSKGHAAPAWYVVLAWKKIISKDLLNTFGEQGSVLTEHPNPHGIQEIQVGTGSLGHGLPIGAGIALGAKMKGSTQHTFVIISDGELNEGSVWESALFAARHKLQNLTVIIDYNKWQATGRSQEVLQIEPVAEKWRCFGWSVQEVDGHDEKVLQEALTAPSVHPRCIVAHTIKGKGIPFMEDDNNWHYRIPTKQELKECEIHLLRS